MNRRMCAGQVETSAICIDDGQYVLYRGIPKFKEDDAKLFAASEYLLEACEFVRDHKCKKSPCPTCRKKVKEAIAKSV
jgi:hypothetical protein